MSTDREQQQQHYDDVSYDMVDEDVANETEVDQRILANLTDWHHGQNCLIHSWQNSPFNGKSCYFTATQLTRFVVGV